MGIYEDILPIGTTLIVGATCFIFGVVYSNWHYDIDTLWRVGGEEAIQVSLAHYQHWGNAPVYIPHVLHAVVALGFIGCFIKLFKPSEDAKYFEYGTLGLYLVGVVIYLTNIRIGVLSAVYGEWGEVDMPTGINVMAASQVIMIVILSGVFILQAGLYYANWEHQKRLKAFYEAEAVAQKNASTKAAAPAPVEPVVEKKKETAAKKRTSRKD